MPIFGSCAEAKENAQANASLLFVPASAAKEAILDGVRAEFKLIVAITEGISQWDMVEVRHMLNNQSKTRLVGPNCPGIIRVILCYLVKLENIGGNKWNFQYLFRLPPLIDMLRI